MEALLCYLVVVVCVTPFLGCFCPVIQEFLGRGPLDVSDSRSGSKMKQCVLFLVSHICVFVC